MAREYVFLVHGMGDMEEGKWHDSFVEAIISALQQYHPYANKTPEEIHEDDLRLIPITYDGVFVGFHDRWENLSEEVAVASANISPRIGEAFEALSRDLGDMPGWQQFFWTHLLDALLWYVFDAARKAVIMRVNEQIIGWLKEMMDDPKAGSAHVLAHSLGTSVVHDSLVALRYWKRDEGAFKPGKHKWHTVGMVANVGRLLEATFTPYQDVDVGAFRVYDSALKPGVQGSICENYVNVHHKVDPFTWPRRFRPDHWPDDSYSDFETVRIRELTEVHDFDHYLADPRVHRTLLGKIKKRSGQMCTDDERRRANDKFATDFPTEASMEFENLRTLIGGDFETQLPFDKLVTFLFKALRETRQ